ncbi:MAG: thermonuclease family protein [Rickettsiales bacterium]|nr:thermonuclease family protein [Rickettsiales bacterium]
MKKIFLPFLLFPLSVFAAAKNVIDAPVHAVVDYVFDGDTFSAAVLMPDDIEIDVRVRIMQIDTPEMAGECDAEIAAAGRARTHLAEILPAGSRVTLRGVRDDKYLGRIDAYVTTAAGADVGEMMIRAGHARRYDGGRRQPWCENQ